MFQRLFGAALAASLLVVFAVPAYGDIVELRDGTFRPKNIDGLEPGVPPSRQQLDESRGAKAELAYDFVKIKGETISSAQVVNVYSHEGITNSDYNDGETYGASANFDEAAVAFEAAASEMSTDAGKQTALRKAMQARQFSGRDLDAMVRAAENLIAQSPRSLYLPEAQMLRARVFASQGKGKEAKAALDAITSAPAMNARDYFEAELTKINWFQMRAAGRDAKKLAAVEKAYRGLATAAGSRGKDADIQKMKALVGAGKCLVYTGKYNEAREEFEAVTNDNSVSDKELLGAAYNGLGDAIYSKAKSDEKSAGGDAAKKQAVYDALSEAALHYLRVTELYGDDYAPDEVGSATENLARVFANQFVMSGSKDCKLGERAYSYYRAAWQRLGRGEQKNQLGREALQFKKDLDAACPPKK